MFYVTKFMQLHLTSTFVYKQNILSQLQLTVKKTIIMNIIQSYQIKRNSNHYRIGFKWIISTIKVLQYWKTEIQKMFIELFYKNLATIYNITFCCCLHLIFACMWYYYHLLHLLFSLSIITKISMSSSIRNIKVDSLHYYFIFQFVLLTAIFKYDLRYH